MVLRSIHAVIRQLTRVQFAGFYLIATPALHVTRSDSAYTSPLIYTGSRSYTRRSTVTRGVEQQQNRNPHGGGHQHRVQNKQRLDRSPVNDTSHQQSLIVAVIGLPNAGKSTLANRLIGHKISGVSSKRNTTIDSRLGSFTDDNAQVLLYDTPGLVDQPCQGNPVDRLRSAWATAAMADQLLLVVDAERQYRLQDQSLLKLVRQLAEGPPSSMVDGPSWQQTPAALFLNKQDKLDESIRSTVLQQLHQQMGSLLKFDAVFYGAAMLGQGVSQLKRYLVQQAVPRPWSLPAGQTHTSDPGELAVELVRERLFRRLNQELPYRLVVTCVSAKLRPAPAAAAALAPDSLAAQPLSYMSSSNGSSSSSSSSYSQHNSRGPKAARGPTPEDLDLSVLADIQPTLVADEGVDTRLHMQGSTHQQQQPRQQWTHHHQQQQQWTHQTQQQQPTSVFDTGQRPHHPISVKLDATQHDHEVHLASSAAGIAAPPAPPAPPAAAVPAIQPLGPPPGSSPAVLTGSCTLASPQVLWDIVVQVTAPSKTIKSIVVGKGGDVINNFVVAQAQADLARILKLPVKLSVEVRAPK